MTRTRKEQRFTSACHCSSSLLAVGGWLAWTQWLGSADFEPDWDGND